MDSDLANYATSYQLVRGLDAWNNEDPDVQNWTAAAKVETTLEFSGLDSEKTYTIYISARNLHRYFRQTPETFMKAIEVSLKEEDVQETQE